MTLCEIEIYICMCAQKKENEIFIWRGAALCGCKQVLGASDKPLHQFTGTEEDVMYSLARPSPLSTVCFLSLSLSGKPSVTLMRRHVLHDAFR